MSSQQLPVSLQARRAAYDEIRSAVYDLVAGAAEIDFGVAVKITPIAQAITTWEAVWVPAHPGGAAHGGFDWREAFSILRHKAERFDAAIWCNGLLCGLAIGKPSRGKRHVTVYLLEGARHTTNPLKGRVLAIILTLADEYAKALNAGHVRLMNPVPGMIQTYQALGYRYRPKTTKCPAHCEREVQS